MSQDDFRLTTEEINRYLADWTDEEREALTESRQRVCRFIRALLHQTNDFVKVAGLTNETMFKALLGASTYERPSSPSGEAVRRWLFGIARNVVADGRRDDQRWARPVRVLAVRMVWPEPPVGQPDEEEADRLARRVRDRLAEGTKLSPERIEAGLRALQGEKAEALAAELRLPVTVVHRATHRVRRYLLKLAEDPWFQLNYGWS